MPNQVLVDSVTKLTRTTKLFLNVSVKQQTKLLNENEKSGILRLEIVVFTSYRNPANAARVQLIGSCDQPEE